MAFNISLSHIVTFVVVDVTEDLPDVQIIA